MDVKVKKRSGELVEFDLERIKNAIAGANFETMEMLESDIEAVAECVAGDIENARVSEISVEQIQNFVETALMVGNFHETARAYIRYRQHHTERRNVRSDLVKTYREMLFSDAADVDLKRDNANINTNAPMGIMLKMGTESSKYFTDNYVLPEEFAKADAENWIHIHDKDFSLITLNCCQIDLLKLFRGGFSTGHGFLREPNSIRAYASLACIAIQSNQNDMFGGQSINAFDFAMAEGVRKSFHKALVNNVHKFMLFYYDADIKPKIKKLRYDTSDSAIKTATEEIYRIIVQHIPNESGFRLPVVPPKHISENIYVAACRDVEAETFQAMEALIHNFNTLHSRAGAQVPFSSINYGMDTSNEGQLVIDKLLDAIDAGLGNGETPIFPISVFQLKAGVNYNEGDPNYHLFQKACRVSAKRLFPNFMNLDAPYNLQYYRPGDYNSFVATMGCRTRVMSNVNGKEESGSRGNFAFVTINLPKLALEAKENHGKFWLLLEKYIKISHDYLLHRFNIIAEKRVYNFPFLMGQGVWMDSEKLRPDDKIREVLKHASFSIGFCGLAECLVALVGKHHGESQEAQKLGLEIVGRLREWTDKYTADEKMNWTTFATPAESTAGQFQRANRKKYGIIEGVTDREYMTNSSHVPVYFPITALKKIRIEAPYHALCNAGHIGYIEMDGDPTKNVPAFERIVRAMHDSNMGYFSINHPVDRDPVCGYTGIIENECPHCGRKEKEYGSFVVKRWKPDGD